MEENKGAVILLVMLGVAIGAWSAAVTLAMLILSLPVTVYSIIRDEPWLDHFFEP